MAEEKQEQDPEAQGKPIGEESPVFPDIGDPEAEKKQEEAEKRERGEAPEPEEPKEDPDKQRLERELEESRERERRMQATMERLAQQPQQGVAKDASEQPDDDSDLGEPPDPVNDPKGYHQYMTKLVDRRAQRQAQQITQTQTQQQTQQQQMNDLWNRFQSKHSDVAAHDMVVEGVTKREVERLRNSGVDPMQYIGADPDGFMDRVADESRRYLQEKGVPLKSGQETDPNADSGRTAGLDGSRPQSPKGKGGQDQGTSFIDDIKKEQVKSGFY